MGVQRGWKGVVERKRRSEQGGKKITDGQREIVQREKEKKGRRGNIVRDESHVFRERGHNVQRREGKK